MKFAVLSALLLAVLPVTAQHTVSPPSPVRLAMGTVFKGEAKFRALVQQAEKENWRQLPLGARTIRAARAMVGTPYINYSLEVDDRIESPVVKASNDSGLISSLHRRRHRSPTSV